jgi:hypothetical protein
MDITKPVQGIAVYGEFARSNATTQVIITPEGYDSNGKEVSMNVIRRTVTDSSPRKQWRFSTLAKVSAGIMEQIASGKSMEQAKEDYCDERFRYASALFDQLLRGDWTLVGEPLLIEVSKIDLDNISEGKTPTKLLYRVTQSRIAKGYPTDLVNATISSTTTAPAF